ncbi:lytic transglycosylase domain-containing protein [Tateyamaria sp.]|uniref:lytic transglycosylase domain-containing protein n=1 Tax=Tateyamaria sp. TaxID=1929288 RepID=UPI00329FDD10
MRAVLAGAMIFALVADASVAQTLSSRNRTKLFSSQKKVLDTRAAKQYSSSVRLQPPKVITPTKWDVEKEKTPKFRGRYSGPYLIVAQEAARRHGVPADLFLRLVQQESGWNATAESHKGAYGLAQLLPSTARELGVNHRDPAQNLDGGAKYLKQQYLTFGSWRLALAAYNAGPGAVRKHKGVPPFRETRNYVRIIWGS